ncbi:MAG: UPF0175 family protein [Chloroflexi bacterium]|nr:UPF0175 family protein [Chloroflexota bacterium]
MAQKLFTLQLPDELLEVLGWPESEIPARIRELLVMELLRQDRLSESTAAELLGLDRWQLLDLMGRSRVPAIQMSSREMRSEVAGARRQSP